MIYIYERTETTVSSTATAVQLLNQKQLIHKLGIGKWMVDDRIQRYPKGSEHEFPVEKIGRFRRFDPDAVRAWFAWEAAGFPAEPKPSITAQRTKSAA